MSTACRTVRPGELKADALRLASDYVYCSPTVVSGKPLFLARQLRYMVSSYTALYGDTPQIDAVSLRDALVNGFRANGSGIADLYLCPPTRDGEDMLLVISPARPVFDPGYSLSGLRQKAVIANYDIPFRAHLTSVSRAAALYSDGYARRRGAHAALRADRSECLVSCGDHPLAAARGKRIIIPPEENGRPGAEREILLELCRLADMEIAEEPLPLQALDEVDELLVFRPEGLAGILECSGRWFYNTVAQTLEKHLPELTRKGLKE